MSSLHEYVRRYENFAVRNALAKKTVELNCTYVFRGHLETFNDSIRGDPCGLLRQLQIHGNITLSSVRRPQLHPAPCKRRVRVLYRCPAVLQYLNVYSRLKQDTSADIRTHMRGVVYGVLPMDNSKNKLLLAGEANHFHKIYKKCSTAIGEILGHIGCSISCLCSRVT